MHPRSEMSLNCLDSCISNENPKKYPDTTAGEFLEERIKELGLKKVMVGQIVYSTNSSIYNEGEEDLNFSKNDYVIEVCFEKKGRAGKGVTILKGFLGNKEALNSLAKEIKTHLAIGGSTKKGEIILQGRIQEKVINFLKNKGYKTKKVGG